MRRVAVVVVLVLALLAGGCAGGPECRYNSDCKYGFHCAAGSCLAECRLDMDCMHGLICDTSVGRCTSPDADGGVPPSDGPPQQTDGPLQLDGPPPQTDGPLQHDGPLQSDTLPPSDGPVGHYPDKCEHASDCDSALCLSDPHFGDGHCLPTMCSAITQCQMGDICVQHAPLTVSDCLPSDIGNSCNGSGQCLSSCAYNQGLGIGVCTNPCSLAADCPAGWTCSPYGSPAAMLCMPPDLTPCADDTDCVFPVDYGGVSACVGTAAPGRCLNTCRTVADCPADHTCYYVSNLGINVCLPPTDPSTGTGSLGDACTTGDGCRSGRCLGTICTERCGVTHAGQFCPFPYGCLPVDDGSGTGTQVLVCVVAGSGDLGASCVDQSSCRSALCVGPAGSAFCTKFCNDGICPSGMSCQDVGTTADGVALKACAP